MGYMPSLGGVVLFGGTRWVGPTPFTSPETWLWDGRNWTKLSISLPVFAPNWAGGGSMSCAVYDSNRQRLRGFPGLPPGPSRLVPSSLPGEDLGSVGREPQCVTALPTSGGQLPFQSLVAEPRWTPVRPRAFAGQASGDPGPSRSRRGDAHAPVEAGRAVLGELGDSDHHSARRQRQRDPTLPTPQLDGLALAETLRCGLDVSTRRRGWRRLELGGARGRQVTGT